jgi:hypothetical protein
MGSRCLLACGRSLATGSQTGICSTCLSNLSVWRRRSAAERIKYRAKLDLAERRQEEIIKFPKGYKILGGRPVKK